jgi:hypothetical protein
MGGVSGIVDDALSGGADTSDWMNTVDSPDFMSDDNMADVAGMLGSYAPQDSSTAPIDWSYPASTDQSTVLDPASADIAAGEPNPASDASSLSPADELDLISQVLGTLSPSGDATATDPAADDTTATPVDDTTATDTATPVDDGSGDLAPGDVLGALSGIIGGMGGGDLTAVPADDASVDDSTDASATDDISGTDSDVMAQLQGLLDQFSDGSAADDTSVDYAPADQDAGTATVSDDGQSASLDGPGSISSYSSSDGTSGSSVNGVPVGDGTYDLSSPELSI